MGTHDFAGFAPVPDDAGGRAARGWWDANSNDYLSEHGDFLGAADFCWCPEGLRESDAGLLGNVCERRVLEVGCGAAQCSRWLVAQGARVLAADVSAGMLAAARRLDDELGVHTPLMQADARALPISTASIDIAFSAFGAIPFVPNAVRVHSEVARVLRPGGSWVFSVTHPVRWAFPDDPTERGLTAVRSYFDRTPYVESIADEVRYVEYHRTLGDHVAEIGAAGLVLEGLVEPEWPPGHDHVWGGWGPVRGALLPGTAIFSTRKP